MVLDRVGSRGMACACRMPADELQRVDCGRRVMKGETDDCWLTFILWPKRHRPRRRL